MFKELFEGSITVDISDLMDTYSDGGEYKTTDFEFMIDELKTYGLKDKDWTYGDDETIIIPSKYKKYLSPWAIKIVTESRDKLKAAYLNKSYSIKDVEKKLKEAKAKKARAYIQYTDKRSRSGLGSGDVIKIESGKVWVTSRFGSDMKIDVSDISMLDIVK